METMDCTSDRVFTDGRRIYTASILPGERVYRERLHTIGGTEYREWDPRRSKLSAYLTVGGRCFPFKRDSRVLYLGASSGTTPSHVADICADGRVFCVEFAQRMFRDLVKTCEGRPNMMPILGDATKPSEYNMFVDSVEIIYQDVAQKRQADIACDNMDHFGAEYGMVAVKARSEDVTSPPEQVFKATEDRIRKRGYRILDTMSLEPYEKAHEMIVIRRND